MFCPSIQCPSIEYLFSARGCLRELDRVLGLGEPFLGELKLVLVLELVEGFLEELKLVLEIVEFFCLLVQQPWCQRLMKNPGIFHAMCSIQTTLLILSDDQNIAGICRVDWTDKLLRGNANRFPC